MENQRDKNCFIEKIKAYESDTFSAKGTKITDDEAFEVANRILSNWIENHLDGTVISCQLLDVRDLDEEGELYE